MALVSRDQKRLVLANGESLRLSVASKDAPIVLYGAKFTSEAGGGGGDPVSVFSGVAQSTLLQFQAPGDMTDGDNMILYDENGQGWGFWANVSGAGSEPSYPEWDALDSDHKVEIDVSGDTTAQQVATNFRGGRLAFPAGNFSDYFSASAAVSGEWTAFAQYPDNGYTKANLETIYANSDNSGAGSITATDTLGEDGQVDPSNDQLKIPSHGFSGDEPITFTATDGSTPSGVDLDTEYYVGVVDPDQINLLDAPSGNLIDIGGFGTGTMDGEAGGGGGSVDLTLQIRGSMEDQGADDQRWHEPTPTPINADGQLELQTLNNWPFATTQMVITNNGDPCEVDAGLIARR